MLELWIAVIATVAVPGTCDLYSSITHLQSALYAERDIAKEIRDYVQSEQERLQKLNRLADEFESHSATALQDPDKYMGNPVNAYLFVKHFTLDWDNDIDVIIRNNSRQELSSKIDEMRQFLPTYEDLSGSVNALLRLQDTYKLDTAELASGNVGGVSSNELSAWDCFELGRLAYNNEDFYHTIMWMDEALSKLNKGTTDTGVKRADILDYLAFSLYKQGNVRRALKLTNEMLVLAPDHPRANGNKDYYEKLLKEEDLNTEKRGDDGDIINNRQLDEYRSGKEYSTYEALCRGEDVKENKYRHRLVCRYTNKNNNPVLILAPAKEEQLYLDPYVSMFHDSIRDHEIHLIKHLATPKLDRATVHNPKTGKLETATYRVSKSCWLSGRDSPDIEKINTRISAVTGLSMDTAEELQIANYGIGGQYEPHFDFARRREPTAFEMEVGNRIATFMFYISDVPAGGATVFPYLGLKIFPQKGSAVFWYNLFKNGEGIYDTRHAACPVLVGSKWVSNKWIHERGQEFRRPCGLKEFE
ncbi:Prolyl 4-hydroxylase subunit alpha-1 [Mactra antiquata]